MPHVIVQFSLMNIYGSLLSANWILRLQKWKDSFPGTLNLVGRIVSYESVK